MYTHPPGGIVATRLAYSKTQEQPLSYTPMKNTPKQRAL